MKPLLVFFFAILQCLFSNSYSQKISGLSCNDCAVLKGDCDISKKYCQLKTSLKLEVATKDSVKGVFTYGSSSLYFTSVVSGEKHENKPTYLSLTSGTGKLKINAKAVSDKKQILSISAGKERLVIARYVLKNQKDSFAIKGKSNLIFDLFEKYPEMWVLPLFSYELGVANKITGNDYPASMPLHRMAMNAAKRKRIITNPERPLPVNVFPCTGPTAPAAVDCFGMCGPDCEECWAWVCGDCCCHVGCQYHDLTSDGCWNCADTDYWSCLWWITNVYFALTDCRPCDTPTTLPPCMAAAASGSGSSGGTGGSSGGSGNTGGGSSGSSGGGSYTPPHPDCGPGEKYCSKSRRCIRKSEWSQSRCVVNVY